MPNWGSTSTIPEARCSQEARLQQTPKCDAEAGSGSSKFKDHPVAQGYQLAGIIGFDILAILESLRAACLRRSDRQYSEQEFSLRSNDFYGASSMSGHEFRHAAKQETPDASLPM